MFNPLRRFRQAQQLFINQSSRDPNINDILVAKRYSDEKEVSHYAKMVRRGLFDHEKSLFSRLLHNLDTDKPILIVGGGCGREAFALHNMGFKVDVIDISSPMIQKGRELSEIFQADVNFTYAHLSDYNPDKKYGCVFICTSLLNFIQSKKRRLLFLRKAYDLLDTNSYLIAEVDVFQYKGLHRFNIASRILKWKMGEYWEKGDTLRSFYGKHNTEEETLFYHFYQNKNEVSQEFKEIGIDKTQNKDDFFWGLKS